MSEQLETFVTNQIDLLMGYCKGFYPLLNLGVTYYQQRDNYTMPHRTCNSSSNAMYLDWLRRSTRRSPLPGDDGYLKKVLSIGDTIYHENQTDAIKAYGFSTKWVGSNGDRDDRDCVDALLDAGFPVVVNILHRGSIDVPTGGHVICLIGKRKESESYIAHDPYGTLASNYTNSKGAYSKIDLTNFIARWQGGYRVLV